MTRSTAATIAALMSLVLSAAGCTTASEPTASVDTSRAANSAPTAEPTDGPTEEPEAEPTAEPVVDRAAQREAAGLARSGWLPSSQVDRDSTQYREISGDYKDSNLSWDDPDGLYDQILQATVMSPAADRLRPRLIEQGGPGWVDPGWKAYSAHGAVFWDMTDNGYGYSFAVYATGEFKDGRKTWVFPVQVDPDTERVVDTRPPVVTDSTEPRDEALDKVAQGEPWDRINE